MLKRTGRTSKDCPGFAVLKSRYSHVLTLIGALLAFVGFFVVPVVGMLLGFVLGVYLAERGRLGPAQAWPSTVRNVGRLSSTRISEKGRVTTCVPGSTRPLNVPRR